MKTIWIGSVIAVSMALGACASKKGKIEAATASAKEIGNLDTSSAPASDGQVSSATVPGSQADLIARVGTDRVLFDYDSYSLNDEARVILQRQVQWLNENPGVVLTIEGHCDERGTRDYNLALGERRAVAVSNYLSGLGIAPSRLRTISYGKERPEAVGSDEAGYAQNRRAISIVAEVAS